MLVCRKELLQDLELCHFALDELEAFEMLLQLVVLLQNICDWAGVIFAILFVLLSGTLEGSNARWKKGWDEIKACKLCVEVFDFWNTGEVIGLEERGKGSLDESSSVSGGATKVVWVHSPCDR